MQNVTLKQSLSDSLWQAAQTRETRFIALEEAARVLTDQAAEVAAAYAFARDEANTLRTADGVYTQCAMRLTHKATGKSLSVIAKLDDAGAECWFILDMSAAPFPAAAYIKAVQNRLEANRTEKNRKAVN